MNGYVASIEIRRNEVREIMKDEETIKTEFQDLFGEFKRENISDDDEGEVDADPSLADEASPYGASDSTLCRQNECCNFMGVFS
ncbi:hypothetical protein BOTNAR_0099g00290 [Botryotinia narcissicola]|uniref:Uncharacterized protein n=1 Tax=Botryotinia narcissicola TaxID=278944 RepID=A0A4Z1IVB5_9HELO|nr:hypothetical protein BOTNAR_0099g00290 [Botryotinia narcissicola]